MGKCIKVEISLAKHRVGKILLNYIKVYTARKTIFPRFWNIIESSKRPRKYYLSIDFLTQKTPVFPITEKFKTRTFQ